MKDKIYKSFEDWKNEQYPYETTLEQAYNARNAEIQELKDKVEKLRNYYNCKHNCFNVDDCISSKHFKCDKWEIFE